MIVHLNGEYKNIEDAKVSICDRGFIFSDGLYEVFLIKNRKIVDLDWHLTRLTRSLKEMNITLPNLAEIPSIAQEILTRNNRTDALMYIQVTRGVCGPREHNFPHTSTPTFVMIPYFERPYNGEWLKTGIKCITVPDIRWQRRDIKTICLLPNVMAKQQALDAGAHDAIFVESDGTVTEATSSNAHIITKDGMLKTHDTNHQILPGITRLRLLSIARSMGLKIVEEPFTYEEMMQSESVFLTNSGGRIRIVSEIDGKPINDGIISETTLKLYHAMEAHVVEVTS